MPKFELSPEAENDFEYIGRDTQKRWGVKQRNKYLTELYDRFQWLADNPQLGLNRDDVKEGYRSYFQGSHTIFFRETNEGIEIIGIPHHSEDIEKHFEQDNLKPSYKDLLNQYADISLDEPDAEQLAPQQENDEIEP